ncbi:MAG TPA: tyrosine-type recombinase/integrase [Streptosporangiaceae bacterium]
MTRLAPIMQGFFTDHLIAQRHASPHTVASYRDTLTLLLGYAHQRSGKLPAQLDLGELDAALIGSFLTHLEEERGNSAATRNARLTAIRALFRYASLRAPEHAVLIARVLAIPAKRTDTTIVCFLAQDELDALITAAAAAGTWHGRRDHALLALAAQTGLRVSELTGLRISDIHLGSGPHVYCRGKGRRDRCTPLTPPIVRTLTAWLRERRGQPDDPVFPTQAGNPMSRDAVSRLLTKYAELAGTSCPSLKDKTISPHTLRHSAAMALVAAGVDPTVIALWMGHASPLSTRPYLHADMKLKQQAADRLTPPGTPPGRYHAPDELLVFLADL